LSLFDLILISFREKNSIAKLFIKKKKAVDLGGDLSKSGGQQVQGQPRLHSETLSQKNKTHKFKKPSTFLRQYNSWGKVDLPQ
jgi:hypothetical protein